MIANIYLSSVFQLTPEIWSTYCPVPMLRRTHCFLCVFKAASAWISGIDRFTFEHGKATLLYNSCDAFSALDGFSFTANVLSHILY